MCLPFFHKYKVVKARKTTTFYYNSPVTVLNLICKNCYKTKIKVIDGHFNIEDFEQKENK